MIKCSELNMVFETKREMFLALKHNKEAIIGLKKAKIHKSDEIDLSFYKENTDDVSETNINTALDLGGYSSNIYADNTEVIGGGQNNDTSPKGTYKAQMAQLKIEKDYIYPIISNTNYFDSHKDVHFDGFIKKSVGEQQHKIHYIVNHKLEIGNVIAYPKDVEMLIKNVSWRSIGKNYDGYTEALIFKTKTFDYSNKDAVIVINKQLPARNSIRMIYLKVVLGINDNGTEFKEEKKYLDKKIDLIVNAEKVLEAGYFFGVEEAKIVKEGSMVLYASNDATPIIYEPFDTNTQKEAEKSLHRLTQKFLTI